MTATPDPLIHPISRLSICGVLAAGADWVEFAALRDAAGINDSVLSMSLVRRHRRQVCGEFPAG